MRIFPIPDDTTILALWWSVAALMGVGAFLLITGIDGTLHAFRIRHRMAVLIVSRFQGIDDGSWPRRLVLAIGRLGLGGQAQRLRLGQMLVTAGFFDPSALEIFGFVRAVTTIASGCGAIMAWSAGLRTGVPFVLLLAAALAAGFIGPTLLLTELAERRARSVRAEMPIVMSLMLMTIDSGSNVDQAIRFVAQAAERGRMGMARILRALVDDIGQGGTYEQALARLGDRLNTTEGRDFAALLAQSINVGAQIGDGIRGLINDMSEKRVVAARESIGRRAVFMSVVMILCFMPALFILIGAPLGSSISHTLSGLMKK